MKNHSKIISISIIILTAIILSGCAGDGEQDINQLTFGYQPSTHQIAYMTAAEKGWWEDNLEPHGIETVNENEFPTGSPEMQAMLAGDIDVAYVGAAPFVSAVDKGLNAKIVAGVQTQGSSLVLRPEFAEDYEEPQDLEGLKIATFPPGTIQDTILRNWLKDNGLDPDKDVDIVGMGPGDAISAISAERVDGVFLPHPAPAIIESENNGQSVVESGKMWDEHACCVLVISDELINNNPEITKEIVKTHVEATEYNKNHMDEAAQIFANYTGWEVSQVKKSLNEWDGQWIADPKAIVDPTVNYAQVQYELGYIDKNLKRSDMFNTSFYESIDTS
ncbi:ABC transporter substrate-binding protein [Methanohalobium sp.]|uniref:ABC transporter substrate-binding protein n=1 Tax=Methanohalobium sp. TaxID=2837493 RepID=UPI0025E35EB4|nr:ABC transporter substrate-binding protein [Methanohalobium sp.]